MKKAWRYPLPVHRFRGILRSCLEFEPAGPVKVFIWRKVSPAKRVILPSKKGDSASRVSLQAEPTFRMQKDLLKEIVFLVEDTAVC